jgi:uncharacterized protein
MLSPSSKTYLEETLRAFSASTTHEIAVVTVPSLGDRDTIESLSIRFADTWKIGKEGADNGIIFLIARDDREARIEVGYGLEGRMPDTVASQVLRETVFPKFKEGKYDEGIVVGTERIMDIVKQEVIVSENTSSRISWSSDEIETALIFGVWALVILAQFLARTKTWWQGGVLGFIFGAVFGVVFYNGFIIALFAFVIGLLGLITDYILSKIGPFGGGGGYAGPMSWGGFGGGSSGGGFGGFGGGSFGGGGASGKW